MLTSVFDTDKFIDLDRSFHELVPDADATDDTEPPRLSGGSNA